MGKANIKNLRTPSTEQAREMQKKSAEKRSQNIKERKLIRQVIEERLGGADLEEIVDNLIDRAKRDSKDFEVLQSAFCRAFLCSFHKALKLLISCIQYSNNFPHFL